MTTTFSYDLAVIGGGNAGLMAARRASKLYGKRVVLIEDYRIGGTCALKGCTPKIMLHAAAEYRHHAAIAASQGVLNGILTTPIGGVDIT